METLLKKLVEYFALVAILGFFLPFAYSSIYFNAFSINILNFVEYTEITVRSAPFVMAFILAGTFSIYGSKLLPVPSNNKKRAWSERKSMRAVILLFSVVFVALILSIVFIKHLEFRTYTANSLAACIVLAFLIFFIGFYIFHMKIDLSSLAAKSVLGIASASIGLMVLGDLDASAVKKFPGKQEKIVFKYNDRRLVVSDSSLVFFGRTKSAIFLYNVKERSTSIFRVDKIDSLVVKALDD